MRFVIMLAAFAAICSPAMAQEPVEPARDSDVAALTQCVAARETYRERLHCIGAVTRVCTEEGGDAAETTGGAVACARRERAAWRASLDRISAALTDRESETQRLLLRSYLREGETWSISRCAYAMSAFEGGSLAGGGLAPARQQGLRQHAG